MGIHGGVGDAQAPLLPFALPIWQLQVLPKLKRPLNNVVIRIEIFQLRSIRKKNYRRGKGGRHYWW